MALLSHIRLDESENMAFPYQALHQIGGNFRFSTPKGNLGNVNAFALVWTLLGEPKVHIHVERDDMVYSADLTRLDYIIW